MRSALQVASVIVRRALFACAIAIVGDVPNTLAQAATPAPSAPRASAGDLLGIVDRLPTTTRWIIAGRNLDQLSERFATTPIGLVASQQSVVADVASMLGTIGTRTDWPGVQILSKLLGDQAILVAIPPEKPGSPSPWALFVRVSVPIASHLQAKLEPQPGEVIGGLPVLTFDRGRYAMAMGRPMKTNSGDQRWIVLCPRDGGAATLVVPALNETAPATLGKLTTAQELRPATDGSLLVLVDWSVKRGEWSSSLAFGASKADNAYDLSWRIREPAMDAARPAAMNESPAINDGSILIALSERALLASTLTPAMRIMSLLRSFDPGTPAQPPAASQRTAALRKVNGKLRLDAILPSRAEPSDPRAIDRAVLGFVASIENKPAQELTLDARVPRMTEVIPEQGTILRAVMGDRLNLWWSPELGTATLAGAADEALPAWTPANMPRETTWLSAGRIRPRELIASIPPDMRDRVGMIGLRSVMESIDTIDWTMSLQGEGDKAHVRGTGRLTLSPAKPK